MVFQDISIEEKNDSIHGLGGSGSSQKKRLPMAASSFNQPILVAVVLPSIRARIWGSDPGLAVKACSVAERHWVSF